ncbi:SUMF1/EgtB/PvdO family nonheme iron enzyme [Microcystis aeruginosa]|uniref:SUMF1/EgtB/PvdO family nonheme iron enzyme n=1 Tax=Microcystis aeruginosa TaxID=1126 RepID=UPI00232B6EDD|nr:SUMF1/EgtB/PvdO family nonheme iron enzyme [Microcystis aeruginosa]MDB9417820.1 SUMF1/EgtB/PvdO family nonheme iron enzyme [Microcystis aeruginosa CS-556/03]
MAEETAKIKLYRKTYQLPQLNRPDLLVLQDQIQERQQLIKTGKRVRNTWLGLRKKEEPLNFEETFQELERLVGDYNQLIRFLTDHKDKYRRFFQSLTEEIKEAVAVKCQKLAEKERKRQSLENSIGSTELRDTLRLQKQQIFRTVILFGRASLLMLKKIDLISESIQKLAEDQDTQKQVFSKMIGELNGYKQVYQLQLELDNLEQEAIEMAKVAINLEQYLKPIIGQFQGLIDRVATIDGELSRSVSEVESLVQNILSSESAVSFRKNENLSASLLNFLVTSEEKRGRLAIALERAEQEGWQWTEVEIPDEEIELETAIQRINNHVIKRVGNFITSVVGDSPNPQTSFIENLANGVRLEMVNLPAGEFLMGSPDSAYQNEKPPHQVTVNSFAIGKYPVTQAQYQAVMGTNPSYFQNNPQNPVEQVSWNDAQAFCQKLSQIIGKTYRLPTEAEWEYACRAGTTTRFYFGDDANLKDYGWYDGNSQQTTHPVGQKKPNAWGLYDMSGNVWEWCEDNWHDNYKNAPKDGSAWLIKDNYSQILRGGSWFNNPYYCRSACRDGSARCFDYYGFRVVCGAGRTL